MWLTVDSLLRIGSRLHLRSISEVLYHFAVAGAAIAGGLWAYYRAKSMREMEAQLAIEIALQSSGNDQSYLVGVEVEFTNHGKHKIDPARRNDRGYVYDRDGDPEKLRNSCSLEIRRIGTVAVNNTAEWYESEQAIGELDLASAFEFEGQTELFFEPGESTKMLRVVRLEPGDYLFKATFVGAAERDFYTRTVFAHVPTALSN